MNFTPAVNKKLYFSHIPATFPSMTTIHETDAQTLRSWLEQEQAILIDVREVEEYLDASIQGAILIPLGNLVPASLPCNPDKKIVFQCRSGKRSLYACQLFSQSGLAAAEIYNLAGGIEAWIGAALPVTRA